MDRLLPRHREGGLSRALHVFGGLEWIEKCDWCAEREGERQAQLERLKEIWAARECVADDCSVVFVPSVPKQR